MSVVKGAIMSHMYSRIWRQDASMGFDASSIEVQKGSVGVMLIQVIRQSLTMNEVAKYLHLRTSSQRLSD